MKGFLFLSTDLLKDANALSGRQVLSRTESLCPVCLKKIPAFRATDGMDVFLEKRCDVHGLFDTVIWRGDPAFETWARPKLPVRPPVCYAAPEKGCPFDCGLCDAHRQITCTALLEVTGRCNLTCPYCFAAAGNAPKPDPTLEIIRFWFERVKHAAPACNIQLSGGEPTVRNDLPQIIEMGRGMGFSFIQLNTNGLRLAREEGYAQRLKNAGLSSVFLQFDSLSDDVYLRLRGRALVAEKHLAVTRCGDAGLGVVLVPMVVPGINDQQLGAILDYGVKASPPVRGIHIQPVSYFGRRPELPQNRDRITLPEILAALESQSRGRVRASDFRPPGCENALCSFHGRFFITESGGLNPVVTLPLASAGSPPEAADIGARRAVAAVARQWGAGDGNQRTAGRRQEVSTLDRKQDKAAIFCSSGNKIPGSDATRPMDIDRFLEFARNRSFSISAMAFQDAWNLDLERLRDCCIHVVAEDGRLVPFCAYNLTDICNQPLYRGRS
ncbi:MAG: radical SAM protein [Deltaproteobacteria bacterium]|nr:radical SAM protein [Deltaproteobacteria bacterium]